MKHCHPARAGGGPEGGGGAGGGCGPLPKWLLLPGRPCQLLMMSSRAYQMSCFRKLAEQCCFWASAILRCRKKSASAFSKQSSGSPQNSEQIFASCLPGAVFSALQRSSSTGCPLSSLATELALRQERVVWRMPEQQRP